MLVLLVGALTLHLFNRWHLSFGPWDESIHAIVAQHLAQHPLHPTLYQTAALVSGQPYFWDATQTWLHVPPFGLWAAAASMRLLGETPFALRLPGLLFVVLGMVVSYRLGRRLFGPIPGLVGAAVVGFAPFPLMISQGYMFGDITDVPLILFTPLSILFLVRGYQTGYYRWLVAAGVCQGICYLDKGAIGLAPTGVALALYAAEWLWRAEPGWRAVRLRGLLTFAGAALATAAPYNIYLALTYPTAYANEARQWRDSFWGSVESWGHPPDTHFTTYLYLMYGPALALLLVGAFVTLSVLAFRRRSRADLVVVAWIAALYVPLSIAVSKTPNVTYAAVPAFGFALARFVEVGLASRYRLVRAGTLGVLAGSAGVALLIMAGVLSTFGIDYQMVLPNRFLSDAYHLHTRLGPYLWTVPLALGGAAIYLAVARRARPGRQSGPLSSVHSLNDHAAAMKGRLHQVRSLLFATRVAGPGDRRFAALVLTVTLLVLTVYWMRYDVQVVARPTVDTSAAIALGTYIAQHTAPNATILLLTDAPESDNPHFQVMFWAHRDVFSAVNTSTADVCALTALAKRAGSPLLIATDRPYSGHPIGTVDSDSWGLYEPACA
jgi:4-amino-4-deoxy-L-arabinose transferase-like glycosyltransferase